MSKYETWLDGLEKSINKPKKQAIRSNSEKTKDFNDQEILDAKAYKIQRLCEGGGELELISREFVKTLCEFAVDIVAFSDKKTFQQIIQDINDNQDRIRGMSEEELTDLEKDEGIGINYAFNWLVLSFFNKNGLTKRVKKDIFLQKSLFHAIAYTISEYLDGIKPKEAEE